MCGKGKTIFMIGDILCENVSAWHLQSLDMCLFMWEIVIDMFLMLSHKVLPFLSNLSS